MISMNRGDKGVNICRHERFVGFFERLKSNDGNELILNELKF